MPGGKSHLQWNWRKWGTGTRGLPLHFWFSSDRLLAPATAKAEKGVRQLEDIEHRAPRFLVLGKNSHRLLGESKRKRKSVLSFSIEQLRFAPSSFGPKMCTRQTRQLCGKHLFVEVRLETNQNDLGGKQQRCSGGR
ncbi:hypothetical protein L915_12014 [Phytophthora nicotianae]|uniref:Uncharacterized protein n=1 Tax=Phytophthora nicotianae TaxID=4792 RepID=W2GK28_PHYNI|nr:hypothetical protein L915_12014 [Phytophthora nicotianae]